MLNKFYSKESLEKQLHDLQHQFIIAYENQEPIGFASYSFVEPKRYRLHKLYVSTSLQQKGVGKEILTTIFKAIASSEPVVMELNVNRHNTSIAFYKKMGFTIVKEEDIDIGNGYFMNDYVMEAVV
jgi:ribosomal protein S18 acetylase RimI-like enzyme